MWRRRWGTRRRASPSTRMGTFCSPTRRFLAGRRYAGERARERRGAGVWPLEERVRSDAASRAWAREGRASRGPDDARSPQLGSCESACYTARGLEFAVLARAAGDPADFLPRWLLGLTH